MGTTRNAFHHPRHSLRRRNLTFNEAKAAAGYGACCAATALLLARYWNLLEMEHAVALASEYFDQLLSMESAA